MNTTYIPIKSITEIMNESRERFITINGRLLTEEEAVDLTDEIRRNLREEGILYED